MFSNKQTSLFANKNVQTKAQTSTSSIPTNPFLRAGLKSSLEIQNPQGSIKLLSSGNHFVDQFGKITQYKAPRSYEQVDADMKLLWGKNKLMTLCLVFYIRMITRITSLFDGSKTGTTQRGQGLKHEGIFRMIWLHVNAPETFWKNIVTFISVGSWKDIITMLSYDLQWNGWNGRVLDWEKFGQLILAGLENPNTNNLVKKYLPQIKTNSVCKTLESQADNMIAKWLCALLFGGKTATDNYKNYKLYRQLKVSGTAHQWQQLISQHQMWQIDFDTIHGRALAQLVSGKFITNQGLTAKYEAWIESKPVAKYTGFVYELLSSVKKGYSNIPLKPYQITTINKQFLGLIETAKKGMKDTDAGLMVVVDTSSSMTSIVPGTKVSAYDVAKSMALYFSYLMKGRFENSWIEFADKAKLNFWNGSTPVEKLQNDRSEAYGSTNFQSIAGIWKKIFDQGVPESEFPSGILCISDGCFNSVSSNKSNTKALRDELKNIGFSKEYIDNFKIILWDMPNYYYGSKPQTAFEDFADTPNLFHMSGLDGSVIAFITGVDHQATTPKTSEELFEAAMNQECMSLLEV